MLNVVCGCVSLCLALSHSLSIRKRHAANLYFEQIYLIIYEAEQKESGCGREPSLRRRLLNASLNSLVREKYLAILYVCIKYGLTACIY